MAAPANCPLAYRFGARRLLGALQAWQSRSCRVILNPMQLIALVTAQARLHALAARVASADFYLHPVAPQQLAEQLAALDKLQFAGAVLPDLPEQLAAAQALSRMSPTAQEAGALCTVITTPAGNVGDYLLGRAVVAAMSAQRWDARGARAVIIGEGAPCRAIGRALASLGVSHLTVLAGDRPAAERSLPALAASCAGEARALREASAQVLLEQADLLVRLEADVELDGALLGPHLSLIDLAEGALSPLRARAIRLGASTLSRRDVEAHHLALSLSALLGRSVAVEPLLALLHQELAE